MIEACIRSEMKALFKSKKVVIICDRGKYFVSIKESRRYGTNIMSCNGYENEQFTFRPLANSKCKSGVQRYDRKTGQPIIYRRTSTNAFSGHWSSLLDWW